MVVDSFRFLPRSFRPLYEGRGPFPGEEEPVWAPFAKRLAEARITLLSSAGFYLKASQPSFDLETEKARPEWGDPTWRAIPSTAKPEELGVAHLHINDEDLLADPEIALPMRGLEELAISTAHHIAAMGYQDRTLSDWHRTTSREIVEFLRGQETDGLILAPA